MGFFFAALMSTDEKPNKFLLVLSFLAVYIIWGSTYLAIRFAVETLPPFLMAGARFILSGILLFAFIPDSGRETIKAAHLRSCAVVGALLLLGGNGGVVWAEQWVPSGAAALIIATVALWMMLLEHFWLGGPRPGVKAVLGLFLGFAGLWILLRPGPLSEAGHPAGSLVLALASFSWAVGSVYTRKTEMPRSPLLAASIEMMAGGACLAAAGTLAGEWSRIDLAAASLRSVLAFFYLVFFGALGFAAYIYMLKHTSPTLSSTYAYVNPLIAVLLGWAFAGESLNRNIVTAGCLIITAVMLISFSKKKGARSISAKPGKTSSG